jgi:pSer/pThr/pTyr-binding forkhead associated (FHA) protein
MAGWILESAEPPHTHRMPSGAVRTIGRTVRADFIVDAPLVSRVHCRLTSDDADGLIVEDLDSTNGTTVNGERVSRASLRTGDTLTVGRVSFRVLAE